MSSGESDASDSETVGRREGTLGTGDAQLEREDDASDLGSFGNFPEPGRHDERAETPLNGQPSSIDSYAQQEQETEEDLDQPTLQEVPLINAPVSPEGSISIPDDTPSIQGSGLSSPGSSVPASYASSLRGHFRPSLQPFERRFSSRLSLSPSSTPRAQTPTFLTPHSRQSSVSSQLIPDQDESDTPQAPWEVVRWTKLRKISGQVFSEVGRRNFGRATCLCVAASIVIGTSKGFILVFDYNQVLKSIIGPGTKAIESGSITSLALSADHTTVAGGHADGNIFTWELARPAKPFLHIIPIDRAQLDNRRGDGHVSGSAILHIGFLGTRHTALVSADDCGMAFSHLATRGLGAVGRTVKSTRVLGRYPLSDQTLDKPRKASSVLAFAPLPLGNVEQPTDTLGLTALLTPYLLVIVSTTPIAQTQHKTSRPKELAPHSTLSGCLAWFPAVRLKHSTPDVPRISKTKLVYCWSNILTVLDVEASKSEEKDKPADLHFQARSRWRSEEPIVAVQWLSRSVIGVLTISQRLIILEDKSLRKTDSFDLLQKHIYHQDLFSHILQPVVEQLDEQDVTMHGVVADAFYMSFKTYKSRMFLLGFNDVAIGSLTNWADRLWALMESGDFIAAMKLANSYYDGDADKLTVGLPENDDARHEMVAEKLLSLITASLKYTFQSKDIFEDEEQKRFHVQELAGVCFTACLSMNEMDVLYDEVYETFEQDEFEGVFFETLEPYILEGRIKTVPPDVLKTMITFYASDGRAARMEEIVIRLDTQTMDIDQVTTLCKQYSLYDAVIYVWNQAIGDYTTPLIDLLELIKLLDYDETNNSEVDNKCHHSAMKIFPYLSYSLTGRIYPSGLPMEEETADKAKNELYSFVFSHSTKQWPIGSRTEFKTQSGKVREPAFPYLNLILAFDTASFMSMMNEAFEDNFLDREAESKTNGSVGHLNGIQNSSWMTASRQYIVKILLDTITPENYNVEDRIFLAMFVARNLAKYQHTQTINLSGSVLHAILVALCNYPTQELKDDCQLSVEYLLSVYQPSDLPMIIGLFERAGFHRVLKSVYRKTKQYPKLLVAYLKDTDERNTVFECISTCLRPDQGLTKRQISELHTAIVNHSVDLAAIDASKTAQVVKRNAPALLGQISHSLQEQPELQYGFLQALIEPNKGSEGTQRSDQPELPKEVTELYVQLMCRFEPMRVPDFVSLLRSGDLRLDDVLPALEESGVIDAAIILMARDGLVLRAMKRLVEHLKTLSIALTGLINAAEESPDTQNTKEALGDLLEAVDKYCKVGIWLCQGQAKSEEVNEISRDSKKALTEQGEEALTNNELLWLDLIDAVVTLTRDVNTSTDAAEAEVSTRSSIDTAKITFALRSNVQQAFSALLAATSTTSHPALKSNSSQQQSSFLLILRAFLVRASRSSPSLSNLRSVLASIFTAHTYEESILSLASQFLDKDAFTQVEELHSLRGRGWRPRGSVCEGCRKRAWGPGAGGDIWDKWERNETREEARRQRKWVQDGGGEAARKLERGKGKAGVDSQANEESEEESDNAKDAASKKEENGPLIVFACRHLFHRKCLERAQPQESQPAVGDTSKGTRRPGKKQLMCPLSH